MKIEIIRCDNCNKQADDDYNITNGWIKIYSGLKLLDVGLTGGRKESGDTIYLSKQIPGNIHFCCFDCFVEYFRKLFKKELYKKDLYEKVLYQNKDEIGIETCSDDIVDIDGVRVKMKTLVESYKQLNTKEELKNCENCSIAKHNCEVYLLIKSRRNSMINTENFNCNCWRG